MQHVFIVTLDSQLTDVVGRRVVGQFALFIQAIDVFIVNFRDVADNVGQGGVIRIVAALVAFDFNAGKAVLVNGETRHLDFIKIDLHRNRGETVRARALFFKAGDVVVGQGDDAASAARYRLFPASSPADRWCGSAPAACRYDRK